MRIAHISDLHLRHHLAGTASLEARQSRSMPQLFEAAMDAMRAASPDLLVLSGDLLDFPPLDMDDPHICSLGVEDLRLIAGMLEAVAAPKVVVIGNHDHPKLVDAVFGHLPLDRELGDCRVLAFNDHESEHHIPRRVEGERVRFLNAVQDPSPVAQIHVQHYVVWPLQNGEYPYSYGEAAWMRDQIIASGRVRLVLSGHYHRGIPLFSDQGVFFATVGGFAEEPHPYNIYDVDGDGVTARTYRVGI